VSQAARQLDPTTLGDHLDRLFRAAWALTGSRADAEDLVQETYAKVLARPRFVTGDDDLAYLVRALRNTFINQRRAAARRPDPETLTDRPDPEDPRAGLRPEEAVEAREVFAVISTLKDDFRDALVAVDVIGLTYAEAAELLGTKEATITSRLFRARAQVARGMDPGATGV
jgi:RNA polymerase sigma-70 factor, ECF subfamily